jgi:hypothetical protein
VVRATGYIAETLAGAVAAWVDDPVSLPEG